jgi:hypothetical protein
MGQMRCIILSTVMFCTNLFSTRKVRATGTICLASMCFLVTRRIKLSLWCSYFDSLIHYYSALGQVLAGTGMALARRILGKFLGGSFPLFSPVFVARCLHVPNNASDSSRKRRNCGREWRPVILPNDAFSMPFRDLLHAANLRHGTDGFTSPTKEGFFSPEKSAGFGRV